MTQQLDPEKKFSKWDSSNRLRYTTVAVAICVLDKNKMTAQALESIQQQLDLSSQKLQDLGRIDITHFQIISSYDKRTLSLKHISLYASVGVNEVRSVKRGASIC